MGSFHLFILLSINYFIPILSYTDYDNNTSPRNISIIRDNYQYYCYGNCDDPKQTESHPGIILMGGGTDVDDAFKQQIDWSGCGDFLVLRASGEDGYNEYIYDLGCSNSVATIVVENKEGANDEFVIDKINGAAAIFFAGGDQDTYLQYWQGTLLQDAVNNAINDRNVSIGGTSAGAMIQSYYIYSASNGSVYSHEALQDPYNRYMQFSSFFVAQKLNILYNTIIDTHFEQRNRFGRLFAMVARLRTDHAGSNVKGIGINEQTAICIDLDTGFGKVVGPNQYESFIFMIVPGVTNNPEICEASTPLTYDNVDIQKLEGYLSQDTFNFASWTGGSPVNNYKISVNNGRLNKVDPYVPPFDPSSDEQTMYKSN